MTSRRPDQPQPIQRRTALGLAVALLTLDASAQSSESAASIELKNRRLNAQGITLEFPALADTGNAIPFHASVTAPPGLTLTLLEVFLPENPNPQVLQLRLIEPQTRYSFSTRLRLAASQSVWLVASFSDGSQRAASAETLITSSACFDAS
ncbi:MAG: thiosulfate oxidation carrier protein SoxY [Burkholderiaceae bacterium]